MKLSLSVQALERLLGGDTDLEAELRHQVVEQFSKRHLRDVVKSEVYQRTMDALRASMQEAIREQVIETTKTGYGSGTTAQHNLKMNVRDLITATVKQAVDECVQMHVKNQVESAKWYWERYIRESIQQALGKLIEKNVQEILKGRIEAAVAALQGK